MVFVSEHVLSTSFYCDEFEITAFLLHSNSLGFCSFCSFLLFSRDFSRSLCRHRRHRCRFVVGGRTHRRSSTAAPGAGAAGGVPSMSCCACAAHAANLRMRVTKLSYRVFTSVPCMLHAAFAFSFGVSMPLKRKHLQNFLLPLLLESDPLQR